MQIFLAYFLRDINCVSWHQLHMRNVANISAFFCKATERGNGEPCNKKKLSKKEYARVPQYFEQSKTDENPWQGLTEASSI